MLIYFGFGTYIVFEICMYLELFISEIWVILSIILQKQWKKNTSQQSFCQFNFDDNAANVRLPLNHYKRLSYFPIGADWYSYISPQKGQFFPIVQPTVRVCYQQDQWIL